jgi:hypothetical protein
MGVREGRNKGGRKEICPTFSDCARVVKKNFYGETFQNCCLGGGRSDYEKFILDSIFPTKLTEFPTKLADFVPFIFIIRQYCPTTVKPILPDWLCLPDKLGGGGAAAPIPPRRNMFIYYTILSSMLFSQLEQLI